MGIKTTAPLNSGIVRQLLLDGNVLRNDLQVTPTLESGAAPEGSAGSFEMVIHFFDTVTVYPAIPVVSTGYLGERDGCSGSISGRPR